MGEREKLLEGLFGGSKNPHAAELASGLERAFETVDRFAKIGLPRMIEDILSEPVFDDRERKVMRLMLIEGMNQEQIGQKISRSRWTVGRIRRKALPKMQSSEKYNRIENYMDFTDSTDSAP